jgi:hypothetical protein
MGPTIDGWIIETDRRLQGICKSRIAAAQLDLVIQWRKTILEEPKERFSTVGLPCLP